MLAAAFVFAGLAGPAHGQGGRAERDEVDPYTGGDAEAIERAGYASLGPFQVGDGHSTLQVGEALGGVPLLWAETEHFRIGSALEPYTVGSPEERKLLKAELKAMRRAFPKLDTKPRELDPWLRLHLFAHRLEALYDDYLEAMGFAEEDFRPQRGGDGEPKPGFGPYLGMREKFVVLLFEKRSSLSRYGQLWLDGPVDYAYRYYFSDRDSLLFGISAESMAGSYGSDHGLHCAVVYGVTQNLVNGLRGFSFETPTWWRIGVARWFIREIDPEIQIYTAGLGESARSKDESHWEPKVRGRVKNEYFPTLEESFAWTDPNALKFGDHMIGWSRVDYLLRGEDMPVRDFLLAIQQPIPWEVPGDRGELVRAQAARAFRDTIGEPAEFDQAWCKWVLKNYAKK